MNNFEFIKGLELLGQYLGIPDWVKTQEEYDEYIKKRDYLKTQKTKYSSSVASMILLSLKFEEAKKVLEDKEVKEFNYFNDLVKPYISIFFALKRIKASEEYFDLLAELFYVNTNLKFERERSSLFWKHI